MNLIIPPPKTELTDDASEELKKQWKKYNKLNAYLVTKRYVDKLWKLVGLEIPTYKSPYEKYSKPDTYLNKYMYSSKYHESNTVVLHEDNKLFTSLGYKAFIFAHANRFFGQSQTYEYKNFVEGQKSEYNRLLYKRCNKTNFKKAITTSPYKTELFIYNLQSKWRQLILHDQIYGTNYEELWGNITKRMSDKQRSINSEKYLQSFSTPDRKEENAKKVNAIMRAWLR
tara:strand:- start:7 stop:687 length:681 start_codon:yes stop_codon:yes gene_type:complete